MIYAILLVLVCLFMPLILQTLAWLFGAFFGIIGSLFK